MISTAGIHIMLRKAVVKNKKSDNQMCRKDVKHSLPVPLPYTDPSEVVVKAGWSHGHGQTSPLFHKLFAGRNEEDGENE